MSSRQAKLRDLTFRVSSTSAYAFTRARLEAPNVDAMADLHAGRLSEWPSFNRETFARLYRPGDEARELEGVPVSPWASQAHRALETQGNWPELRTLAQAHRTIAGEATVTLAGAIARELGIDKLPEGEEAGDPGDLAARAEAFDRMAERGGLFDFEQGPLHEAAGELRMAANAAENRRRVIAQRAEKLPTAAIARAVDAATERAREVAHAVRLMRGWGLGNDEAGGSEGEVPADLLAAVLGDPKMQRILEMLGRMREALAALGESEVASGAQALVGIEMGDQPHRLVPTELGKLAHPLLGAELWGRMHDKAATCWKLRGTQKRNRGDIVVYVDRSGSMAEERIIFARALAGAVLLTGLQQRRRVTLGLFSDTVEGVTVEPGDRRALGDAFRMLAEGVRGGTDGARAIISATSHKPKGKGQPDILFVSDGDFPVPVATSTRDEDRAAAERATRWRKDGGRIVIVGVQCDVREHAPWTDQQHEVYGDLTAARGGEVLASMFNVKGGSKR